MKNYAIVYLVENDPTGQLMDVGDNPCFTVPPSWGFCHPDIRNLSELTENSRLLFIALVKEQKNIVKYFIKGYFRVKTKINVVEAYNRFKLRKNVIISASERTTEEKWSNKNIPSRLNLTAIPTFLTQISYQNRIFYHKSNDDHPVDNWKCRRIYNCKIESLKICSQKLVCIKERQNSELKRNYIVGHFKDNNDWNNLRVEWKEIADLISKPKTLKIKGSHRHQKIELRNDEFDTIIKHMNNKSCC
jgi:hypothetical protein